MNNPALREVLDLLYKIKIRSKRLSESTQNASQESLDKLFSDAVDSYWALNTIIEEQEKAEDKGVDTPLPPSA